MKIDTNKKNSDMIHSRKSQDQRTQMIRINKLLFDSSMIQINNL